MAKAFGIVKALEALSPEERLQRPGGIAGDDYNELRRQACESYPEIAGFFPPEVSIAIMNGGTHLAQCTFGEMLVFTHEIYQILDITTQGECLKDA